MWKNFQKPSDEELNEQLDEEAYRVTQKEGTELPGSSPLDKTFEEGIYVDVVSGEPLYSSKDKYEAGCGWPSFTKPISKEVISEKEDNSLMPSRTEVRSKIADSHLGHVFNDGPVESTGLRYCINGAALRFVPRDRMESEGYGDYLKYL